ncbi:hypothetical protein [Bradyrhizobium sp. 170]|uniref:hypothetical protein n=1 Tax=Bradyrhizobium sp. 170 TaxID=2782641 RepID=UPI001FFE3471|nr:hypothetical protein [Bradyrhizobium sp. 170]UPK05750.1 hypothetical protein IVB05_09270 [Bradyrhizobium sp. 170]
MERLSDRVRISTRARLLAVAIAAGGMMAAAQVCAADEVTQERLLNVDKEPRNWLHHHQNYSAHRFSTLKEINRDNVNVFIRETCRKSLPDRLLTVERNLFRRAGRDVRDFVDRTYVRITREMQ